MATVWTVGDLGAPSDSRGMETFEMRRLEMLAERVRRGMNACQEILEERQDGSGTSERRRIEVNKLQLAADSFISEVKDQSKIPHSEEDNLKLEQYSNLHFEAQDLLAALKMQNQHGGQSINPDTSYPAQTTSRLPKLDLMKFNGDNLRWHEFWDGFSASVDRRADLSDVDKLTYLISLLEKDAKETVSGLTLTNKNYKIAVDELKEQYGRSEVVMDAHYRAINRIPKAGHDVNECRKTRADLERHLKILSALGEPVNSNNQLRSMIMDKFPENVLYHLRLIMKEKGFSVAVVREGLKNIISANGENSQPTITERPGERQDSKFTTEAFHSMAMTKSNKPSAKGRRLESQEKEPPKKKARFSCIFCQDPHFNDQCTKFRTLPERLKQLTGRCYVCLGQGHRAPECSNSKKKICYHCQSKTHNRCLCPKLLGESTEPTTTMLSQAETHTILQTATANICNDMGSRKILGRLLFDTGSQKTYLTEALAKELQLETKENITLTVYTFGQLHPKHVRTRVVDINIEIPNGGFISMSAHVIPHITGKIPSFNAEKMGIQLSHPDKSLAGDTEEDCPAHVLVGNDYYHNFFSGSAEKIENELYLLDSKLGWIPSGKVDHQSSKEALSFLTFVQKEQGKKNKQFTVPDPPLQDDKIKYLWELECIGIRDSPKIMKEDEIVKHFIDTTKFLDGRYHVKWPWAQFPSDLPINYGMSLGRLTSLLRRTDANILHEYDAVLKDQLSKGIVEIVDDTKFPTSHPTHYLPHHCVVQENKTTKLRIVYDASSKTPGHCSLNEYLFKGPLMLEDLVSLLLVFRTHRIGIVADIEKAFLQIGLQKEDRDVTRFLWVKDILKKPEGDNLIHMRFCRVPFGVISSPFLLAATIRHHLQLQNSDIATRIANSLYVDNLITGAKTTQEAIELYRTSTSAFDGLSMYIREWNSNSNEFLDEIPRDRRTSEKSATQSVLGLKWHTDSDTLMLAFDPTKMIQPVASKREILRIIASVYDPCGFVAPLLLAAKLFLQNLWQEKFKWDTLIPDEKRNEWNHCASPLKLIPTTTFPRYYMNSFSGMANKGEMPSVELHCFTDASKEAYSAAVYLRSVTKDKLDVNLVISRTRLIPLKNREYLTIPKKELLGVLIGSRLILYVQRTLLIPIKRTYLWTDSKIVIGWLKSDHLLQPFVSKRISEINSATGVQIRYVSSENNPADVATRPQFAALPQIWLKGPSFLMSSRSDWAQQQGSVETDQCMVSSAKECTDNTIGEDGMDMDCENVDSDIGRPDPPIDPDSASDPDPEASHDKLCVPLTQNETIRLLQLRHFPREMAGKSSSLTKPLGLFIDNSGILRCTGRLQNANLPYDQTHPILLPKSDPFTLDTIKRIHEDSHHVGVSHTLAQVRQKFWIPQGRSQVQSALKRCKQCVKYGGGPYKLPPMPPLPAERVRLCAPFMYSGLDYLGPLTVREGDGTEKRWCCIFVCMACRAVRLELVKNLTAEEFLLCLRRFVAAQGEPLLIVSDNAAQFKLVADVINSPSNEKYKIAWHFIPELSPWQGGFYERLVALVKHCLRRSLDKNLLTDSQLSTVLKEIETVLNSRPLTYVGKELDIVLSPSDYLANCGTHPLTEPEGESTAPITATRSNLIDGWKRGREVLEEFTSLFQNYYLTNLRERALAPHKQHRVLSKKEPQVGDVVQIWDGQSKPSHRSTWKVGKIAALFQSRDGHIRTAQVLLGNGTLLNRSISYLYPLELDETTPSSTAPQVADRDNNEADDPYMVRTTPSDDRNASPTTSNDADPAIDTRTETEGRTESTTSPNTTNSSHDAHAQVHDQPSEERSLAGNGLNEDHSTTPDNVDHRPVTQSRRKAFHMANKTIRKWTQNLSLLGIANCKLDSPVP